MGNEEFWSKCYLIVFLKKTNWAHKPYKTNGPRDLDQKWACNPCRFPCTTNGKWRILLENLEKMTNRSDSLVKPMKYWHFVSKKGTKITQNLVKPMENKQMASPRAAADNFFLRQQFLFARAKKCLIWIAQKRQSTKNVTFSVFERPENCPASKQASRQASKACLPAVQSI